MLCEPPAAAAGQKKKKKFVTGASRFGVCVSSSCLHTATTSNSSLLPIWSFVFKKKLKEKRTRKSCVTCQSFTATDTCFSAASSCSTSYIFTLGNKTRTTHGTTHTQKKERLQLQYWSVGNRVQGGTVPSCIPPLPRFDCLLWFVCLCRHNSTLCLTARTIRQLILYNVTPDQKLGNNFFPIDFFVFWGLFF
jgi:hypothetical protein